MKNTNQNYNLPKGADYLSACRKNQLALLSTRTPVSLSAGLRQNIGASKVEVEITKYVRLNADYLALVNQERAKNGMEPLTKTGPLPWGEWVIPNILIAHRLEVGDEPKFYLRYYRETSGEFDMDAEQDFFIDNVRVGDNCAEVRAILTERKAKMQGIRPMCNNVTWSNILSLDLCTKDGTPDVTII